MFRKPRNENQLQPPPIAESEPQAVEVLRVWAAPESATTTLRTTWKDAGAWGLMLVDIARHASKAYANEGQDPKAVLKRIRDLFDAEWEKATDEAKDITPR